MTVLKNALMNSHEYVGKVVGRGDVLVDATCGNGHDTLFLSELTGADGIVYGFDIQKQALINTKQRLKLSNCVLIEDTHSRMDRYISRNIKACMFNLGYLPGYEASLATKPETTVEGIKKAMKLLLPGGIITVVVYHGERSGTKEKETLLKFITEIDQKSFLAAVLSYENQKNNPPLLILIEKL